jgi:hypothetical protein
VSDEVVLRTLHADDLIELVEVLRRDYAAAIAERDRLRAVVDAGVIEIDGHLWRVKRRDDVLGEVAYMHAILVRTQLDVSPTMGDVVRDAVEYANSGVDPTSPTYDPDQYGTPTIGRCPDCGNPDRHCDCPDRTSAIGGEE